MTQKGSYAIKRKKQEQNIIDITIHLYLLNIQYGVSFDLV